MYDQLKTFGRAKIEIKITFISFHRQHCFFPAWVDRSGRFATLTVGPPIGHRTPFTPVRTADTYFFPPFSSSTKSEMNELCTWTITQSLSMSRFFFVCVSYLFGILFFLNCFSRERPGWTERYSHRRLFVSKTLSTLLMHILYIVAYIKMVWFDNYLLQREWRECAWFLVLIFRWFKLS